MKSVNLYVDIREKGPHKRDRVSGYILETQVLNEAHIVWGALLLEEASENAIVLAAMAAGLKRLVVPCYLTIYTDSTYFHTSVQEHRLQEWKYNGWQTKKGTMVVHNSKWQEIEYLLNAHKTKVVLHQHNKYQKELQQIIDGKEMVKIQLGQTAAGKFQTPMYSGGDPKLVFPHGIITEITDKYFKVRYAFLKGDEWKYRYEDIGKIVFVQDQEALESVGEVEDMEMERSRLGVDKE